MYIDKVTCPGCGKKERVAGGAFTFSTADSTVTCSCSVVFVVERPVDQMILSTNPFTRLLGLSTYFENGEVLASPGDAIEVAFKEPVDIVARVFLTPNSSVPIRALETNIDAKGFTVVCAKVGETIYDEKIKICWCAYGLTDVANRPTWYMQFYTAVSNASQRFYKAALFDYAVSFEAFVEEHLTRIISQKHGPAVAEYALGQTERVADRITKLAYFATGKKLSDNKAVYDAWVTDVQKVRNKLFHGEDMQIDQEKAERAHEAVYQAIRYMQDVMV